MRFSKILAYTLPAIFLFVVPFLVFADGIVPCDGPECTICDIAELGQNIINYMVMIAASVAALLFAYAGILYITAGGDSGKISSAHQIFFNVFVGFMLILAAWLIVNLIMMGLLKEDYQDWNVICD